MRFNDSASLKLRRRAQLLWNDEHPRSVLIIKKAGKRATSQKLAQIAEWLTDRGIVVYVERVVHQHEFPQYPAYHPRQTHIELCITLGGDGTVLYMASLFDQDRPLPPVLSFAMGSLGFLTPFDADDFEPCLQRVLDAGSKPLHCTLRTRKRCEVRHGNGSGADALQPQLQRVHHVLNECTIDRGSFPNAVSLEIIIDGELVTVTEADGLIIATPSGSTAYSMAAGGSVVAPSVPCTLITPLSPLSLSFRPLIIPESSDILVRIPHKARSHARASFDGKVPLRLQRGSSISFTTSLCPLPMINTSALDHDWYQGITQKLKWNQGIRDTAHANDSILDGEEMDLSPDDDAIDGVELGPVTYAGQ